ncbi:MAG TPA: helicase-associated domain-containing protein [Actinomycetota bacterium]|nr:helicase-associated domain-containing protein [Actinomycetota bacterium]
MDRQLLDHLRALSPDDLQTVLRRRPETRALLLGKRQDLVALAEVLGKAESIGLAVVTLNSFLFQLLMAAQWVGPQASASAILELAPGADPADLRAGADELARWGLAFPVDQPTREDPLGWALSLPADVDAAVDGGGEGPNLVRRLLVGRTPGFLALVGQNLGVPSRPHPNREAMVAQLSGALSQPHLVQGLLAGAPPKALHLFHHIQDEGGAVSRHELMVTGYVRWSDPPWTERRQVQTALDWLESRCLLVLDANRSYTGSMVIPAEVELALKGGKPFPPWPCATPPPLAVPGLAAPGRAGDPSKVLAEMESLLQVWAENPPAALQKGGLGMRELKRVSRALGFPEPYTIFLYALAVEAGLVGEDDEARIRPTAQGRAWSGLPAPERWGMLLRAWLEARVWDEHDDAGLRALDEAVPRLWAIYLRGALVEELAALSPGEATDARALAARLAWRYPVLLGDEASAAKVAGRAVQALTWLGTASGPGAVALLEPGRSAATDEGWAAGDNPGVAAFAPEVDTCTVGADLTIIVPGPPVQALREALGRFADLTASSPARVYRLTETSLRRALDGGMGAGDILGLLTRHAPRGVPQNVAYLIEDVGRRHGSLVAGRAAVYLRADDPGLLRAALAERKLAALRPRLIAPTVAVLHGTDLAPLLATLRGAGYLPVEEDEAGAVIGPVPVRDAVPLLPPVSFRPLSARQAAALAEAIVTGRPATRAQPAAPRDPEAPAVPASPNGVSLLSGTTYRSREQLRRLFDAAVAHNATVEIFYRPPRGRASLRPIEPFFADAAGVSAWDLTSRRDRDFELGRIEWARAINEPVPAGPPKGI